MNELFFKILSFLTSTIMTFNTVQLALPDNDNNLKPLPQQVSRSKEIIIPENIKIQKTSDFYKQSSTLQSYSSSNGWWTYPSIIKLASRNGNDLLVLVNKNFKLSENYAPNDLVSASNSGIRRGSGYLLRNIIINDLRELVNAAKSDAIDLSIRSGYRSYQDQVTTYNYWLKVNGGNVDAADKISARAGHSQHQLGTVVDFSSTEIQDGIGGQFSTTKAAKWLGENAWKYGFVISFPKGYESVTGYSYESWHYRYIGKSNAQEMKSSNMILENYLKSKN